TKIAETLKALPEKDIVALQAQWEKARLTTMPQPPRAGLAAHWEFDGHLADTSGSYHHGRVVRGEVSYGDGQVGRAAESGGKAAGLKLYVDDKPTPLEVLRDRLTGTIQTAASFEIGNKGTGSPYKGQIDDLRIYNRQLTKTEVESLSIHLPARTLLAEAAGKSPKEIPMLKPEKPKTDDEGEEQPSGKPKTEAKEDKEAQAE